ncbi:MFS transporter [Sphingorhabdus arenilitoris]|uniref:MFS transporter n=1 Tax=Sphingorhabdus arenilitoris TaxID=1490041 RepID=A0ABV8RK68_9SPHN
MQSSLALLNKRRFLPLFVTQFLNAFNDNFFKMAMVILVTYAIYSDPKVEANFNALAGAIFILPFFLFSALAGQLADSVNKINVIRTIKTAEIGIMIVGAAGMMLENVPMMLLALFAMGVHSTFFGPIKYGILPQHLEENEVLGGTGLVEAGTYMAILGGTIAGGIIPHEWSAIGVIACAIIGRVSAQYVPSAPAEENGKSVKLEWNIFKGSYRLLKETLRRRRLRLAIICISFFWAIGAVLASQFPPMVKNALGGDNTVATLFTAIFSVGVAIGSVAVNRLLKGEVSARYSPASVIAMGLFVLLLWWNVRVWPHDTSTLMDYKAFLSLAQGDFILGSLLGIAIAGGMFVVPLYAFLTTTVAKSETSRTIAANNIVNSGAMVAGALFYALLVHWGVSIADTLFMIAAACIVSAWLAYLLHKASDAIEPVASR